jgi:hypothetical protein
LSLNRYTPGLAGKALSLASKSCETLPGTSFDSFLDSWASQEGGLILASVFDRSNFTANLF